jgi:hypothetical protein
MDKVYQLPGLLLAPTSELQLLLRRWFEYADFSAVPALLDELQEQGRTEDRRKVLDYLRQHSQNARHIPPSKTYWAVGFPEEMVNYFFWDLFDLNSQLQQIQERALKSIPNPKADIEKSLERMRRNLLTTVPQLDQLEIVVSPSVAEALANVSEDFSEPDFNT